MRCHVCSRKLEDIMYKCFQKYDISPIICLDCVRNKRIGLEIAIRLMLRLNRLLLWLYSDRRRCVEEFI